MSGSGKSVALRTLSAKDKREPALTILKTVLQQPLFDAAIFEREKARTIAGLKEAMTRPDSIAGKAFWAALYPEHGEQSDALLRAADAALYAAKAEGRGRFTRYSRTLHAVVEGRRRLERDLREAARAGASARVSSPSSRRRG